MAAFASAPTWMSGDSPTIRRFVRPAAKTFARSSFRATVVLGSFDFHELLDRREFGLGLGEDLDTPGENQPTGSDICLSTAGKSNMSFADRTIDEFLDDVAANAVTPSGGAVAAVGGAFGAALCEMVCIHTIEKDDYADVRAELTEIRDELGARRGRLLELADEDSAAVDELQAAFETPNGEDRAELLREKSRRTAEVPLEIAEVCLDVLEHAKVVTAKGNRNALTDAGTGAFLAHAALQASIVTVQSNLGMVADANDITGIEKRSDEIDERSEKALTTVKSNLGENG